MKEIDDTPLPKTESEPPVEEVLAAIAATMATFRTQILTAHCEIELLKAEVADLHHRRRVSRQQAVDQDPEWH